MCLYLCAAEKREILAISIAFSSQHTISIVSHGQHEEKPKLNAKLLCYGLDNSAKVDDSICF